MPALCAQETLCTLLRSWERGVLSFEEWMTSAGMEQTRRSAYFTGKAARSAQFRTCRDWAQTHNLYHYVEESTSVDYRFHKRFSGPYRNSDGEVSDRTYGLFVRKVDQGVVTHVDPLGEMLWAKGLYSGNRPLTGCGLRWSAPSSIR